MRKIGWFERKRIFSYISLEPEMTIFVRGDMEDMKPFRRSPFEIYVSDSASGDYDFLIHKYFDSYGIYSPKDSIDIKSAAEFLQKRKVDTIAGKDALVEQLIPYFPSFKAKVTFLCRLKKDRACFIDSVPVPSLTLRKLERKDSYEAAKFLVSVPEVQPFYKGSDPIGEAEKKIDANIKHGEFYGGAFMDGYIVGLIATTATSGGGTDIAELAVAPEYRLQGIATKLICSCARKLFKDGLDYICLFYEDYQAGKIYDKLGFEYVGRYTLLH